MFIFCSYFNFFKWKWQKDGKQNALFLQSYLPAYLMIVTELDSDLHIKIDHYNC